MALENKSFSVCAMYTRVCQLILLRPIVACKEVNVLLCYCCHVLVYIYFKLPYVKLQLIIHLF